MYLHGRKHRLSLPRRGAKAFCALALLLASPALADHILILLSADAGPYRQAEQAAAERLRRDGHTVTSSVLDPDTDPLTLKADLVLAVGGPAAAACKGTLAPPARLIYTMVSDPASAGLTADPPTPGVTTDVPLKDQFALIAEALPKARTVGLLFNSAAPASAKIPDRVRAALPAGWTMDAVDLALHSSPADAIDVLADRTIDVLWTAPDRAVYDTAVMRKLLLSTLRRNIPVFGFSPQFVTAGALLGTSIDPAEQGRQAAELVVKAPSGSPEDRVIRPRFTVVFNPVVAERLGITLPRSILDRADPMQGDR